ncbi:nicotinate-nucleotide--dimethylbenzimidazole phosphoribosyltransferase [Streptomyces sp. JH14]|uniref:nicotinate-nucleotide--dimethylbenzimidazole phosphoribosyltransferase n=1 Tax=Streptomyces sp. JH14 TaxID=2793630 RepID=UPI0023F8C6AD|nr:nicotinate-nucleotide--dimethylbenzimidazole phosphoribosyltransferase [Streptomyces sp. JH14]MDF6041341.1 nicotinate-nucleotide--dimethylbenzimidazole phosphoribosyltransferase [Streptomyces sp. JH14]
MSDTGQIPGEGLPENAGMVEQPGIPAPGAYTYLDPSEHASEDDDLLLMPSAQGAWSEPHGAPAGQPVDDGALHAPAPQGEQAAYLTQPQVHMGSMHAAQAQGYAQGPVQVQEVPDPAVYAVQQAVAGAMTETGQGTHESGGRDSGAVDLNGVRMPAAPPAPVAVAQPAAPARRPLHRGPASGEPAPSYGGTPTGGVVRSLADRGPAEAPQIPMAARHSGPPTTGPEYLDLPGPQLGEIPPQPASPWVAQAPEQAAVPVAVASEAVAAHTAAGTVVPEYVVPEHVAPEPAAEPLLLAEQVGAAPVAVPEAVPAAAGALVDAAPMGQFVPVEGSVPTTPHLAPTPVVEQVLVEPVPAEQPVVEHPVAEEPVAEQPVAEQAAIEQPVAEQAAQPEAVAEPVSVTEPQPEPVAIAVEPVPDPVVETPEPVEAVPAVADAPAPEAVAVPEPVAAPEPVSVPEPVAAPQVSVLMPAAEAAPEPVLVLEAETGPEVIETPDLTATDAPAPDPEPTEPVEPPAVAAPPAEAPQPVARTADRDAAPASAPAPGYDDAEREAVLRVMRERRDIRNGFRSDPIPHEVLLRVLEAAHTAPSVGHSQPWDFVVIRSAETRRSMHELAQRQREAYAKSLPKGRAKQFKELKIEAILDTPVNIVVTADPTRGGRHTLGRHTQPQMAPYSSALAVENLWLAARAEGLGVGWVSFFDEREMVRALGLPEHLEVVAYLCVGYVDEFPEEPELMQAGWSKRRPLSWVVHEETYGRRALPGEEPHDLLQETISNIRPLDAKALGEAWERQKRMTKPAGALGMLEIISAQLSGLSRMCPPPIPEPAAVAIFAGDHGVHAQGVTAWPQEVTGQMVANFLGGGAVCNAFAAQVGAEVCVVDVGVATELPATPGLLPRKVRAGTADFTTGPALTREEVLAAIEVGIETARDLVAAGNKGLLTGEMGIANTTASAALICVYTGMDPAEVTGRGTGINDEMHARKVDVVRRGLELHQPDPSDPIGVLAAVGGLEHAAMAGFLLGGASLRTPVVLDGVSAGAAALVARAIAPEALAACIAGHRSAEPGHVAALNKLGLRPLIDLDLRLGEGTGALLALPIVQSAARAMHEVATFDSAGVTEK